MPFRFLLPCSHVDTPIHCLKVYHNTIINTTKHQFLYNYNFLIPLTTTLKRSVIPRLGPKTAQYSISPAILENRPLPHAHFILKYRYFILKYPLFRSAFCFIIYGVNFFIYHLAFFCVDPGRHRVLGPLLNVVIYSYHFVIDVI